MLSTYNYHQLLPMCCGVCYTIFRETIALFAQELCAFLQCHYIGCAKEYEVYPVFFLIYSGCWQCLKH